MNPTVIGGLAIVIAIVLIVLFMRGEMSLLTANVLGNTASTAKTSLDNNITTRKIDYKPLFDGIKAGGDTLYAWGGGEDASHAYGKLDKFKLGTAADADSDKLHTNDWAKQYESVAPLSEGLSVRSTFYQPYSMNRSSFPQGSRPMPTSSVISMPPGVRKPTRVNPVVTK